MPGNYTITNRVDEEDIDAAKYMADHQQHVDNLEPLKVDDYSVSLPQMQAMADPGEVGSESQATSLAGELERLRFMLNELKGTAQWYQSVGALAETGDVKATLRAAASTGWLLMDGSTYARATYAGLVAWAQAAGLFGTVFGVGDGSTTFTVPNARGRTGVGYWSGGPYANVLGGLFGEQTHTLTPAEMPIHAHGVTDPGHVHNAGKAVGILTPGAGADILAATGPVEAYNTLAAATGITIQNAGGGLAHNVLQPSMAVNWLIKT